MGRRQFGSVRKLASGRWQASYWHEGARHIASDTFHAKVEANRWLSTVDADLARGGWVDPRAGRIMFADYAESWLTQRTDLRPSTSEHYDLLLRLHLLPSLGDPRSPSLGRRTGLARWHRQAWTSTQVMLSCH
jgi:hypothetical protein